MLKHVRTSDESSTLLNVNHARWVIGVLNMLIAVVGKDSLLGLVLKQTRLEIHTLVQAEEEAGPLAGPCHLNN